MDSSNTNTGELIAKARTGDQEAVASLFDHFRDRLRRMIELRLDHRLMGRVDPSDVLQETYVDVHKLLHEFQDGELPFYLWLRLKVGHRLVHAHRFHLGAQKRSAFREVSLVKGAIPAASSVSLASQLMGKMTSASNAAIRDEIRLRVQDMLNQMDAIDREVLVLRHFEDLSNVETAKVLAISQNAASNRYVRALKRLKEALDG